MEEAAVVLSACVAFSQTIPGGRGHGKHNELFAMSLVTVTQRGEHSWAAHRHPHSPQSSS